MILHHLFYLCLWLDNIGMMLTLTPSCWSMCTYYYYYYNPIHTSYDDDILSPCSTATEASLQPSSLESSTPNPTLKLRKRRRSTNEEFHNMLWNKWKVWKRVECWDMRRRLKTMKKCCFENMLPLCWDSLKIRQKLWQNLVFSKS